MEQDRDHANFIRKCVEKIGSDKNILIRGDVFKFLKSCHEKFDFIFADPPYALAELPKIPTLIFDYDILSDDGVFTFEHGKNQDFSDNEHFVEHRNYGSVNFTIFQNKHI